MSFPKAKVKIIGTDKCPLYTVGDEFKLSGKSMISPYAKPTCLILVQDITAVLMKYENIEDDSRYVFDCSGCTGIVRLEYKKDIIAPVNHENGEQMDDIYSIASSLSNYGFFQTFDEDSIKELVSRLHLKHYEKNEIIIRKDDPGENLYIIATGSVEILADDGIRIAILGRGEIFGEMSLISGEPIVATVRALKPLTVLYLNGNIFRDVLYKTPAIQIYLTRLLARRIANANVVRVREIASGITGDLAKVPPSELFQTLHLNQKTGVLALKLGEELAAASFRDGKLIRAKYRNKMDVEAFFEMLKVKEGRFKFNPELPAEEFREKEIGNFMKLLMEGTNRISGAADDKKDDL